MNLVLSKVEEEISTKINGLENIVKKSCEMLFIRGLGVIILSDTYLIYLFKGDGVILAAPAPV